MRNAGPDLFRRWAVEPWRRRFWAELGWVVLGLPLAVLSLIGIALVLLSGIALSPLLIGLPMVAGALLAARAIGGTHRRLVGTLLGLKLTGPTSKPATFRTSLTDGPGWRAVAYLVLRVPLAVLDLGMTAFLLLYGLGTLTYPLWWFVLDGRPLPLFDIGTAGLLPSFPLALLAAALLLATPALVHLVLGLDRLLARALLGPTTLSERVRDLEESRAAVIETADVKLRRIERDLHDGAQAQLVALAMKLGVAKDELDAAQVDLDRLRALVTAAHTGAKDALAELRDLARGIHPAALDAGLEVALSTLAARSEAEVRVLVSLPVRPPAAIESILYFSAAELLTNAIKHGGVDRAELQLFELDSVLRLFVSDRGRGGARVHPSGGLAGLADRLRAVDGYLSIDSPPGGPTVVVVEIPV
ncbi:sensor histidine kinase [Amycolatopsis magusensis]|uniref:sensor histidine kinase n=1 Tax=Amycolatopsis magusensis TaxID=882444 RepID=UPI0024A7F8E7|nr:sensor histidine kinase [Amycolatopsis magusensis]MDI5974809.1 sensor domain-containing protein [Amycolatopsis magusensis]